MRVLQLIDSLNTGGAERVAVNLANGLSKQIEASFLCVTREEGLLKETINEGVGYLFLKKTKTLDFKAIKALSKFVRANKINVIHAHSTSFFLATTIKMLNRSIKIVWHDHYGKSEFLDKRPFKILKKCSKYFSHIFSVNSVLKEWAENNLKSKQVTYLPNFATINTSEEKITILNGVEGKRIIHLANLRPQKDHFTLLKSFKTVIKSYVNWTLHCVGKDFNDEYSESIKKEIENLELENNVFIHGSKSDIFNILSQSTIAVLPSKSEGLPIALLEYGLASLPTIVTNVGDCNKVVINNKTGLLIPPENASVLSEALLSCIADKKMCKEFAVALNNHVINHFSEKKTIETIIETYKTILV